MIFESLSSICVVNEYSSCTQTMLFLGFTPKQQDMNIHPLISLVISRINNLGLGTVVMSPDGHFFFEPSAKKFECLRGALNTPKESKEYGANVIIRRRRTNVKHPKYDGYPLYQLYLLPVIRKNADTMTDAERRNIEIHIEATRRAHAIIADPEQLAQYQELHAAHLREHLMHPNRPPKGYKKFYPNLFGFLVANLHARLASQELTIAPTLSVEPESYSGIVLVKRANIVHFGGIFAIGDSPAISLARPCIRLPIAA